jgi:hypothetical protein
MRRLLFVPIACLACAEAPIAVPSDDAEVHADADPPVKPEDASLSDAGAPMPMDAEVGMDAIATPDAEPSMDAAPVDTGPAGDPYPDPAAWPPNAGPGGPSATFTAMQLYQTCAYLDGGSQDVTDHHNLVTMYDGYLLMPWAPEFRRGGLTFFDISNPCAPVAVGSGYSDEMRESHSIGFSSIGGRWAVVNQMSSFFAGGIQFWDVSNVASPQAVKSLELPGFRYPDAYARVTLSVFWQAPYVYVAGADNGLYIVDALDPMNPTLVQHYEIDPVLRVGQVQAIGNLLVLTAAEGPRTLLLDIADPADPQPIPGGDFLAMDSTGTPREAYFTNVGGGYIYYARKSAGGGVIIYDIHDPTAPAFSGDLPSDGNGGYVFVKDDFAFTGESSFAAIYDISNHAAITEVTRMNLVGDLDTATPIGNVVVLSVDDDAENDRGSAIAPWQTAPDTVPPVVTWVYPPDGSTSVRRTSRIGLTFSELVDVKSAWEGSVRLYETGTDPAVTRVDGYVSAQELVVTFWPITPLEPSTSYTLEVPARGVADVSGNAIQTPFSMTFTTGTL